MKSTLRGIGLLVVTLLVDSDDVAALSDATESKFMFAPLLSCSCLLETTSPEIVEIIVGLIRRGFPEGLLVSWVGKLHKFTASSFVSF